MNIYILLKINSFFFLNASKAFFVYFIDGLAEKNLFNFVDYGKVNNK